MDPRGGASFTAPGPRAPGASIPHHHHYPGCAPRVGGAPFPWVARPPPMLHSLGLLPSRHPGPAHTRGPCSLMPWCNLSESQRPQWDPRERTWRKTQPSEAAQARPGEVTAFVLAPYSSPCYVRVRKGGLHPIQLDTGPSSEVISSETGQQQASRPGQAWPRLRCSQVRIPSSKPSRSSPPHHLYSASGCGSLSSWDTQEVVALSASHALQPQGSPLMAV